MSNVGGSGVPYSASVDNSLPMTLAEINAKLDRILAQRTYEQLEMDLIEARYSIELLEAELKRARDSAIQMEAELKRARDSAIQTAGGV